MDLKLIDWPIWWKGGGKHFLEGFPIIGTEHKIIKEVQQVLYERSFEEFRSSWNNVFQDFSDVEKILILIKEIVKTHVNWINHYFYPKDNVNIFLGFIPGIIDCPHDILNPIFDKLKIAEDLKVEIYDFFLNNERGGTVLDFISLVCQ